MTADPYAEALWQGWREALAAQSAPPIDWLGETMSADDLVARVEEALHQLQALVADAQPPVRVGVLAADGLAHLLESLALVFAGVSQAVLPEGSPPAERQALAQRYGLTHLLVDPEQLPPWPGLRRLGRSREGLLLVALPPATGGSGAPNAPGDLRELEESADAAEGSIALLSTSSGTSSGRPTLVPVRLGALLSAQRRLDPSPYDHLPRQLVNPSLQLSGPRLWKLWTLLRGDALVVRATDAPWGRDTFRGDPCGGAMPPNQLQRRLAAGDLAQVPEGFLVITGGDHVPMELRRALQAIRPLRVGITFATSQSGPLTWLPPEELLAEPESVGRPLATVQLRPEGAVHLQRFGLAFREMRIRKTRRCLRPDGRGALVEGPAGGVRDFLSGDLLALAPSGHVIFGGRANDVFLFQGQMVSPYEIEDGLRGAPEVADCAGFGAPSATYGAVPMAAVVLREGVADPAAVAERLRQRSRERMGHRSAKRIVVMDDLPRGPGGKPLRRLLAERHALRL